MFQAALEGGINAHRPQFFQSSKIPEFQNSKAPRLQGWGGNAHNLRQLINIVALIGYGNFFIPQDVRGAPSKGHPEAVRPRVHQRRTPVPTPASKPDGPTLHIWSPLCLVMGTHAAHLHYAQMHGSWAKRSGRNLLAGHALHDAIVKPRFACACATT